MTDELRRRRFIRATAAAGLATGVAASAAGTAGASGWGDRSGALTAGAATRDITPENGDELFGYVRPDLRVDGVAVRLFAQAIVIDDGERTVAIVAADLGQPDDLREAVLEHARPLGFDRDTVVFTTTHTHAGPNDMGDWMAAQIGDAIAEADATREPVRAGWGTATVPEGNYNRSIEAHLANYGLDISPGEGSPEDHPVDPDLARNTTLRLLRLEALDGTPVAAWTIYANHPTTFTVDNTRYSADFPGLAARLFADRFDDAPVTAYSNGNLGDVVTPYDEYGMYAVAERTATRVERAMRTAWEDAGGDLARRVQVDGRTRIVEYEGQEVEDGKRVANVGLMGKPLLNGGENGPTPFHGLPLEGRRRPELLADPVHGRKLPLIPAPWSPDVEVQALRVGDRLLATVPGEPTTEMGRRMAGAAAEAGPDDVTDVAVLGIANGYNGYFTTPEEYDQQHYEGGHTVFGKYTSLLVRQTHEELAAELASAPGSPVEPSGSRPDRPDAPVGGGSDEGTVTAEPEPTVERMETLSVEWEGGLLGRDRPVGEPFVRLERRTGTDEFETVATDLDLGLVWTETAGTYTARYDVPPELPTGVYRVRITAARYDVSTRLFEVVPSSELRVRGVRVRRVGWSPRRTLVFRAQHPAPDPETNLRLRPREPRGGTLSFSMDGTEAVAEWDDDEEAWIATVDSPPEETVVVPAGGLEDGHGNHSGERVELAVGDVAPVEWPAEMETGGGNPPGLVGIGEFPT